jgi:PAT family acetyl-CoA transporter-like MFS transporter 1
MPRRTSPARSRSVKTPSKRASSSPARSRPAKYSPNAQSAEEGGSSAVVESKDGKAAQRGSLKGDWAAIGLLMLLYTLQGIPMGLSGSVPFLMQAKGISMTEQAKFSVVSWPFALKLLWAPLVDSVYVGRFGRRKTWIVPAQLCIGGLLLWAGSRIDVWLGEGGGEPDVATLTTLFLGFYFLAATQDIAVDGLALTILSPKNKELGATCNAIGQSVGFFLAYTGFLALYSPDFCNAYLRSAASSSELGIISLGGFMAIWGYVFLASTLWVAAAKGDEHKPLTGSLSSVFISAYKEMLTVLRLPAVKSMALVLLTCRAALGVFDAATPLRLVEAGVPREHLALMSSALFPVGLASQMYVSGRYFAGGGEGSQPLLIWLACYPARLLLGLTSLCIVLLVPAVKSRTTGLPSWMYFLIMLAAMVASVTSQTMFVAQMAFYNRVADPAIGGTYMTMLNTISNMGGA